MQKPGAKRLRDVPAAGTEPQSSLLTCARMGNPELEEKSALGSGNRATATGMDSHGTKRKFSAESKAARDKLK